MSRTIFCTFLQREAEGQDFQLYPGELGKRIYNEISKIESHHLARSNVLFQTLIRITM